MYGSQDSGAGSDASVSADPDITQTPWGTAYVGASLHLEMELQLLPGPFAASGLGEAASPPLPIDSPLLTTFSGTADGVPDITITDTDDNDLLLLDIVSINVSAVTGANISYADNGGGAEVVIVGGSTAPAFGGVGASGDLALFMTGASPAPVVGQIFGQDFDAQMNVQIDFETFIASNPEPGTFFLVGFSLLGMGLARRRR